jgi:hypothetical protein
MLEPRLYGAAPLRQPEDAAASAVEAFLMIYEGGRKPEIGVGD